MSDELRKKFEKEMAKQGRDTRRDPNGQYSDYSSAVMWSWAHWGYEQRDREVKGAMA